MPRFRLLAPLRGSTTRQLVVSAFAVTRWCRSAQNDTWGWRTVGYNPFVAMLLNESRNAQPYETITIYDGFKLYHTRNDYPRVILSGAAPPCRGERKNQPLPRSRTPKGRQQAESRHPCKAQNISQQSNICPTFAYILRNNPPRVISEQTPAAFRRTPKGRRQAESRHSSEAQNIGQQSNICPTFAYILRNNPPRVISEQTPAAFRRTQQGRQQAESRHSCKGKHIILS